MSIRWTILCVLLSLARPGSAQAVPQDAFLQSVEQLQAWAQAVQAKDKEYSHLLQHDMNITLDARGRFQRRTRQLVEIRDERDVQRWSSISIPWRKAYESRPDIKVRVIRPDKDVRLLDPSTIVEAPAGEIETGIYSDAIVLKIFPPGLAPGSLLDLSIQEQEIKAPFQSGRYLQAPLRTVLPVDRLHVTVSWHPSIKLRYRWPASLRLQKSEGQTATGWPLLSLKGGNIDPLNPLDAASLLANEESQSSSLEISSAPDWSSMAEEYSRIVADQSTQSRKVPALIKKLMEGRSSPAEIIAAVTYYVQKEIRYTSLAFGEASTVPRSPDETLERAYGDCKDKATLALALLKAAGINARLALLHTAPHTFQSDDMPGLDRFNHVILAVQQEKSWIWIDLTADFFRPGLVPPQVAGQKALLIGPEGQALVAIPPSRLEDNQLTLTKKFQLARLGPAQLQRTEHAQGIFDAFYRQSLANSSAKDLLQTKERALDADVKIVSAQSSDHKNLSKPIRLEAQFQKSGLADMWPAGAQIFAFPQQIFTGLPEALDPLSDRDIRGKIVSLKKQLAARQGPVGLPFPFQRDVIFHFHLPPHMELSEKPVPTRLDLGPASFSLKTEACGPQCFVLHYTFHTGTSLVWTAQEAKDFANGLNRILDDKLYLLTVKPKALLLSEEGKLREAVQYAQKVVQEPDGPAADRLVLAQLMARVGLREEAQALARDAAQTQPPDKRILLHAAELLLRGENRKDCSKGSDCPTARQFYEQVLTLDATNSFALRALPSLLVFNQQGLRFGPGVDMQKVEAAFAKAIKSPLAEDHEFFNSYLQYLTFTGQWIALDQALRQPPESMPPATIGAWKVITLIGNQHPQEAKAELDQLLTRNDGQNNMQSLIRELLQARRYKEASQLFLMLQDKLPQTKGTAEAMALMNPCPESAKPDKDLKISVRNYICTMLSPDSAMQEGLEFVPHSVRDDADYRTYFEQVEWSRRLDNARGDQNLPPYFLIDSASTAYDIEQAKDLEDGKVLVLHQTKPFAASPFASSSSEEGFEPRLLAVQEKGSWHFIALDTPSVLSMLWFRAHDKDRDKAARDYALLLDKLLEGSLEAATDPDQTTPDAQRYQSIVKAFRSFLQGNEAEQELAAAVYAPAVYNKRAVQIFDQALARQKLSPEQQEILDILAAGRLIGLKRYQDSVDRLVQRSERGPFGFSMVQPVIELARSGAVRLADLQPLLQKLEQSSIDERLNLVAEIRQLLGDERGAEAAYQQGLKSPAPNGLTENNVAWFYFTTGRSDQRALQLAQKAIDQNKQSVANLNTLASIQAELGLTAESMATQDQYRGLLGERSLGPADEIVTAINAEKLGLAEPALKRLKKILDQPEAGDMKKLLQAKIQLLETRVKAR